MRLDLHATFTSLSQGKDGMLKKSLVVAKGKENGEEYWICSLFRDEAPAI
jgi:hypothetical protein